MPDIKEIRKKLKKNKKGKPKLTTGIPAKYQTVGKKLDKAPPAAKVFRKVYETLMQKGKVAQVPVAIIEDDNLKAQEKLLFIEISSHSYVLGFCYASNEYLAHKLNLSARQINTYVQSMKEKEYIKVFTYSYRYGKRRFIEINFKKLREATQRMEEKRNRWITERNAKDQQVDEHGHSIHSPLWRKENRKRK